jgi:hypothetical protein
LSETKVISSEEAMQISLGIASAMMQGDKEAREAVYSDLSDESLKKVIRWTTRWWIGHMATICAIQGIDMEEAWKNFAMLINAQIAAGESEE